MATNFEASLPMYDFSWLRWAHDALWAEVAARWPGTPPALTRSDDAHVLWTSPNLGLSQTCGWPLVTSLRNRVCVVGSFVPLLDDAPAGTEVAMPSYRSVLLSTAHRPLLDLAHETVAANSLDSLSGWISLIRTLGEVPTSVVWTGSHRNSIEALLTRRAALASVDAVTYALLVDADPSLAERLVPVGRGPVVRTLPLITQRTNDVQDSERVHSARQAFSAATAVPSLQPALRALRIRGFAPLDQQDYTSLLG